MQTLTSKKNWPCAFGAHKKKPEIKRSRANPPKEEGGGDNRGKLGYQIKYRARKLRVITLVLLLISRFLFNIQ